MKGTLYCVGVGPGDPELLTLKALKIIRTCPVLAVPQSRTGVVTAQGILMKALDGCGITIDDKTVIAMDFPMTRDDQVLKGAHEKRRAASGTNSTKAATSASSPWAARRSMRPVSTSTACSARPAMRRKSCPACPASVPSQPSSSSRCAKR